MEEVSSLADNAYASSALASSLNYLFSSICSVSDFLSRSTNLYRVTKEFQTSAQVESGYGRIKRCFHGYTYCYEQLGKLILHRLPMNRYLLCMDRSNWEYGTRYINYLVVSIAWQGVSIPIAWTCLDKNGGNFSSAERI